LRYSSNWHFVALQDRRRLDSLVAHAGIGFVFTATVSLVTGTMFLMWLGEQITERGLGNGISMIIFAGIVAGLPQAFAAVAELVRNGELNALLAIFLFVLRLPLSASDASGFHAKRQQGRGIRGAALTCH
jgi:preprotein translocase subunit SecY